MWSELATIAGLEQGSPYAWLRNLSRAGSAELASAAFFSPRKASAPEGSTFPEAATAGSHFGIFGMETANVADADAQPVNVKEALVGASSSAPSAVLQENEATVTVMCAARLTGEQVYALETSKLSKVWPWTTARLYALVSFASRGQQFGSPWAFFFARAGLLTVFRLALPSSAVHGLSFSLVLARLPFFASPCPVRLSMGFLFRSCWPAYRFSPCLALNVHFLPSHTDQHGARRRH